MENIIAVARALADENRMRALLALGDQEICVCQLIELLQLAPSTVSKHMSVLKQARLVVGRKKGRWMYYRLPGESAPPVIRDALAWVHHAAFGDQRIALDKEQMKKILGTDRDLICQRQSLRRKKTTTATKQAEVV